MRAALRTAAIAAAGGAVAGSICNGLAAELRRRAAWEAMRISSAAFSSVVKAMRPPPPKPPAVPTHGDRYFDISTGVTWFHQGAERGWVDLARLP